MAAFISATTSQPVIYSLSRNKPIRITSSSVESSAIPAKIGLRSFFERANRSVGLGPLVTAVRLAVLVTVTAAIVVPVAFFVLPVPARADGVTLCLPGIGPLQQFAEGLEGDQEEVVHLHERVHAAQCRRLGAAVYASTYWRAPGRIALEAEALCAEFGLLAAQGSDPDRLLDQTVEALYNGYRNRQN